MNEIPHANENFCFDNEPSDKFLPIHEEEELINFFLEKKKNGKISRPPNSFMVYRHYLTNKHKKENVNLRIAVPDFSRFATNSWENKSPKSANSQAFSSFPASTTISSYLKPQNSNYDVTLYEDQQNDSIENVPPLPYLNDNNYSNPVDFFAPLNQILSGNDNDSVNFFAPLNQNPSDNYYSELTNSVNFLNQNSSDDQFYFNNSPELTTDLNEFSLNNQLYTYSPISNSPELTTNLNEFSLNNQLFIYSPISNSPELTNEFFLNNQLYTSVLLPPNIYLFPNNEIQYMIHHVPPDPPDGNLI
ncbi:10023_t:CDS:2 [Diversispora eburnea]|uniref:10023_t:CDS:1 n=1 Tax=Diversispora eburnea TaxID=1213867 RepID=A0A9N9F030_9GLOM|nr:10023_t:CDS:2 [Diversispora eburnea]